MYRKYKFISILTLFWNIGCCFVTLGGWNDLTNSQTYKYSIVKNCFISYFTFIMGIEKRAKFSPCERKFVCQHEIATVKLVFNLPTTYFMEDMVRTSFQNVIITCIWCFGRCFQPSCADQREKIFPSCSFSWWKWDLIESKICLILSFCIFSIQQMWENNTQWYKTILK